MAREEYASKEECFALYKDNPVFKEYVDKLLNSYSYRGYSLEDILSLKLVGSYAYAVKKGQNSYSGGGAFNMYANNEA